MIGSQQQITNEQHMSGTLKFLSLTKYFHLLYTVFEETKHPKPQQLLSSSFSVALVKNPI